MSRAILHLMKSCERFKQTAAIFLACALLAGAVVSSQPPAQQKQRVLSEIALPAPQTRGKNSLEEILAKRRSVRRFSLQRLSINEIGQLLWAAQGITEPLRVLRTAPSAGASHPLEMYIVAPDGLFHYLPEGHRLQRLGREDLRRALAVAAVDQDCIRDAAINIVIVGALNRLARFTVRAERYMELEVGHAAQNVLLEATALGIGCVPVGAFYDDQVKTLLHLPGEEEPLYIIAIGHPR